MPNTWSQGPATWSKRIDRAAELAQRNPWASEVLGFYGHILHFQKAIYERTKLLKGPAATDAELRQAVDLDAASAVFPISRS